MKLLIVADVHARKDWWHWLCRVAPAYDGVIVAGDLIDGVSRPQHLTDDRKLAEHSCETIRKTTPVFIAEGNHHAVGHWAWMKAHLGRHRLEGLVIQTLPYADHETQFTELKISRQIAEAEDRIWICVEHYPPIRSRISGVGDNYMLEVRSLLARPDILVCGHIHEAPFKINGSWHDIIGQTLCLNPGCLWGAEEPCHIILDFAQHTATWITPMTVRRIAVLKSGR